jgi:uncharacterized protein (DUF2141 family)
LAGLGASLKIEIGKIETHMRKSLFQSVFPLVFIFIAASARAGTFTFSTGSPNGLMGPASRPGVVEVESADDFIVASQTTIGHATFAGLIPLGAPLSNLGSVAVEIYRIFPADSANPPSGRVPTRVNSPSDVAFDGRDSAAGTLAFTASILTASFTTANSVVNGINPIPNQTTGGEGASTGEEISIDVTFTPAFTLPAGHYFFVPQVALSTGNFLWLSAPRPTSPPFIGDLQSWIRNSSLAPDWLRIGTDIVGGSPAPTFNGSFSLSGFIDVRADFNGDGQSDILLRDSGGSLGMWLMNGSMITTGAFVGSPGGTYTVAGIGDFNGDGKADILLRDSNGNLGVWLMNGSTILSGAFVGSPGGTYTVAGIGDFNGDGKADILLRDSLGNLGLWFMNGATITSGAFVGSPGGSYTVAGMGDFNGDGKADILLRDTLGNLGIWFMNGSTIMSGALVGSPGGSYTVAGVGDFNGDGKADILLRDNLGNLGMWIMNGPTITSGALVGSPGGSYTVAATNDYNGDGKADILLRDSGGNVGMWIMNGPAITSGAFVGSPGTSYTVY